MECSGKRPFAYPLIIPVYAFQQQQKAVGMRLISDEERSLSYLLISDPQLRTA